MLNNEWISCPLHFNQMFEEWPNILGPKYKTLDTLNSQFNCIDLLLVWIDHFAIASFQTVHEPFAVECRYISFVTCRDYHRSNVTHSILRFPLTGRIHFDVR